MTSIHTSAAVMTALAASRSISGKLMSVQQQASTGLRIGAASDNASYWSIATTMRSDTRVLSTVQDALQLAAGMADVAYTALHQTTEVLSEIRAKLVLASNDGVDLAKIQREIANLAQQTVTIAESASYAGTRWLNTSIDDIYETTLELRSEEIVSSFVRTAAGGVRLEKSAVDLQKTSLFNEQGGGILQSDPRSPWTIGGIRTGGISGNGLPEFGDRRASFGGIPSHVFSFVGPLTFGAGDFVSFDIVIDKDNPDHGLPGPLDPGVTATITIDKALVDGVLGRGDGVILDYEEALSVLSRAMQVEGIRSYVTLTYASKYENNHLVRDPDKIVITSSQQSGKDGAYLSVEPAGGTIAFGALGSVELEGSRGASLTLPFQPFKIYKDVVVSFDFETNDDLPVSLTIDRTFVDTLLGKDDGRVETVGEMQQLLEELLTARPDIAIEVNGNSIQLSTTPDTDRRAGGKSQMRFTGINVNIEPIPLLGVLDIDIDAHPDLLDSYLFSIEGMLQRTIDGAAAMGAVKMRIDIQSAFVSRLADSLERGVGQLVDADMSLVSARMQALEVQRQLAINSISMASAQPQMLLQLFG